MDRWTAFWRLLNPPPNPDRRRTDWLPLQLVGLYVAVATPFVGLGLLLHGLIAGWWK